MTSIPELVGELDGCGDEWFQVIFEQGSNRRNLDAKGWERRNTAVPVGNATLILPIRISNQKWHFLSYKIVQE